MLKLLSPIFRKIIIWKFPRLLRDCARVFGYNNNFTIGGITYKTDPCSVGRTPLGELTAGGAIQMIKERGLRNLRVLDIACGVGTIGLTIYTKLKEDSVIKEVVFADINIFNLNSLRRTLAINNLSDLEGKCFHIYLSDALKHIPKTEKFDIVVSNPPNFFIQDFLNIEMSGSTLGRYSRDWSFHKSVYGEVHEYLTTQGEVWFLENSEAIKENEAKFLIEENPNLTCEIKPASRERRSLYWTVTKKK